ncbi:MAG: AMP-binding protein [Deltaproteobacteria bacterium]|nr:AMP-binding protein [Deltaproteobacteria bacterium]
MIYEGFTPYDPTAAEIYEKRRWWLGMTLGDILDKSCDLYPLKEALVGEGKRYTYREFRRLVDHAAYGLLQHGLRAGDTMLLQLPNCPEFVISYFAMQKIGVVMVLLTVNHSLREIVHLANLTQPKGWILPDQYRGTDFLSMTRKVRTQGQTLERVYFLGEGVSSGELRFKDLLGSTADPREIRSALEEARPDPRDVCQILPSGGTTGLPKGAPRTHNDYLCNIEYTSKAWDLNVTDTCLVATTVGHNLALLVTVTASVFHGATMVLLDSSRPDDFCRTIQEERVTCTGLVPTLISRYVSFDRLHHYDMSSLKRIYVGAANSPPELVRQVEERIGGRYINAFGMVEGPLAQSRPQDPIEIRCNTIGRACCPYDELITLDEKGNRNPPGKEGELAAKGPGVFTGYLKNPQANQDAFTKDGYFRTGDLAVIDLQGVIRITGRIKDIIIRGGENIAARDVEDMISSHPGVEYVAVVGMPDPDLGELVCAFIKPVDGARLSYDDVIVHMKALDAAKAHLPARIEFVEQIPLTAAGKADKKALREDIRNKLESVPGGGEPLGPEEG